MRGPSYTHSPTPFPLTLLLLFTSRVQGVPSRRRSNCVTRARLAPETVIEVRSLLPRATAASGHHPHTHHSFLSHTQLIDRDVPRTLSFLELFQPGRPLHVPVHPPPTAVPQRPSTCVPSLVFTDTCECTCTAAEAVACIRGVGQGAGVCTRHVLPGGNGDTRGLG